MGKNTHKKPKKSLVLGTSQTLKEHIYTEIDKLAPKVWDHIWTDMMEDTWVELSDVYPGEIHLRDVQQVGSKKRLKIAAITAEFISANYLGDVAHSASLLAWAKIFEAQAKKLSKAAEKLSKGTRS